MRVCTQRLPAGLAAFLLACNGAASADVPAAGDAASSGDAHGEDARVPRGPGLLLASFDESGGGVLRALAAEDGRVLSERKIGVATRVSGAVHDPVLDRWVTVFNHRYGGVWHDLLTVDAAGKQTELASTPGSGGDPALLAGRTVHSNYDYGTFYALDTTDPARFKPIDLGVRETTARFGVRLVGFPASSGVGGTVAMIIADESGVRIRSMAVSATTDVAKDAVSIATAPATRSSGAADRRGVLWTGVPYAVVAVDPSTGNATGRRFELGVYVEVADIAAAPCQPWLFAIAGDTLFAINSDTGKLSKAALPSPGRVVAFSDEAQTVTVALGAEPGFAHFSFSGGELHPATWSGPRANHVYALRSAMPRSCDR